MYDPSGSPPPPVLPPKPSSHEASRLGTPSAVGNSPRPAPPLPPDYDGGGLNSVDPGFAAAMDAAASGLIPAPTPQQPVPEDPGELWLPKILEDKS